MVAKLAVHAEIAWMFARARRRENQLSPALGAGVGECWGCAAAEAAATNLARRKHSVVAASAATNFVHRSLPRAERGARLSCAPSRAAVARRSSREISS